MSKLQTDLFRKNFLICKLMYNKSKLNESNASANGNRKESTIESLNQQLILKIALLELAGWIEATLDYIYVSLGKTPTEKELIERHISSFYSFNPNTVTECLKFCMGETRFKKLKDKYKGAQDKSSFKNMLEKLSSIRNCYAHTCLDTKALPGGQPGLNQIQQDFLFLLKSFCVLLNDLNTI